MQLQIQDIIKAHPELKIRADSEFFEDDEGNLYAMSADSMLKIQAVQGEITVQKVEKKTTGLHMLRNIATQRGD